LLLQAAAAVRDSWCFARCVVRARQVIHGDLEPTSGSVTRKGLLRVGYFNQHFEDALDLTVRGLSPLAPHVPRLYSHNV
jgi:hypothetical protein